MEGKKFGKWEVLNQIKTNKPGKYYECICKCGTISIKAGTELRAGRGLQCRNCQYRKLYNPLQYIDKKYGKWTILEFIGSHRNLLQFKTQCECGNYGSHLIAELKAGKSKQCTTCHNRENAKKNIKHGMHNTKIYKVWQAMLERCSNKKSTAYKWYGGRGIKVCDRWRKFENFYKDMGDRPEGLTLDRIDNNGDYKKSNCRWITHQENCNNRYY